VDGDGLAVAPNLPTSWSRLTFQVRWRGRRLAVEARRDPHEVWLDLLDGPACAVRVGERTLRLRPGEPCRAALD
jgi:trehalose/maltose hydrolase-like predicted phosphorylase